MAKGLRIGVRVKAKVTKILGARGATQRFDKQASKVEMRGEIVRKEATTKWVVRWDKPLSESAWNARSLTREDDNEAADEGPDNSTTSNDESSDSDEAPDVVEHVAPDDDLVAGPVAAAAAVENLLVVDGIVWTPSDIITADHFDGNVQSIAPNCSNSGINNLSFFLFAGMLTVHPSNVRTKDHSKSCKQVTRSSQLTEEDRKSSYQWIVQSSSGIYRILIIMELETDKTCAHVMELSAEVLHLYLNQANLTTSGNKKALVERMLDNAIIRSNAPSKGESGKNPAGQDVLSSSGIYRILIIMELETDKTCAHVMGLSAEVLHLYLHQANLTTSGNKKALVERMLDNAIIRSNAPSKGESGKNPAGQDGRQPLTIKMLKELSQSLYASKTHSTHDRLMLQAALAVAFFGFLRVSKFTVNSWKRKAMRRGRFLAKQDVLLAPYYLQLTIKYSKMDQLGKGSIITMGLTRSSLLSSPRHAILLKVLSCQASFSIIPLPVWQAAVSQKAMVHPPFSVAPEQL
eukprot:Em0001g2567a